MQQSKSKDIEEQRSHFPALANKTYFNHGAQGVLSSQALAAIVDSFNTAQSTGPFNSKMFAWLQDQLQSTKQSLASELGGQTQLYALTQNATEGCNIVLWGIDWQKDDHILLTDSEHFGVAASARQLSQRLHLELSQFCAAGGAEEILDNMVGALKPRTRLVVASHVLWNTGSILPIKQMQQLCRQRSILFLVDGAQSAGVVPIDVEELNIDAFALTGHKWLGGPEGIGALYIAPEALDWIAPTFVGWRSVQYGQNGEIGEWEGGATRFEAATAPFPLMAGLRTAIAVHQRWGSASERYHRLHQLTHRLHAGISKAPEFTLLTAEEVPAGLVSFTSKSRPQREIVRLLEERNIMVRTIPVPDCIRASVHYLNTEQEIDDLIAALS